MDLHDQWLKTCEIIQGCAFWRFATGNVVMKQYVTNLTKW